MLNCLLVYGWIWKFFLLVVLIHILISIVGHTRHLESLNCVCMLIPNGPHQKQSKPIQTEPIWL